MGSYIRERSNQRRCALWLAIEGIEAFIITTRLNIDQEQFSQELRYASTFSETFDVTAGLYYFSQDLNYGEVRAQGSRGSAQPGVSDPNNPFGIGAPTYDELEHESWAVFAEARWILNDQWSLIAGADLRMKPKT